MRSGGEYDFRHFLKERKRKRKLYAIAFRSAHEALVNMREEEDLAATMKVRARGTIQLGSAQWDDPSARGQSSAASIANPWTRMGDRPSAAAQRAIDKARRTKLSASQIVLGSAAFDDVDARGMSTAAAVGNPWEKMPKNRPSYSAQAKANQARRTKLSASTLSIGCAAFDDVGARGMSTAKVAAAAAAAAAAAGKHVSLAELHAENKARKTKLSASTITLGCADFDDPSARLSSTASLILDPWLSKEYGANRPSYSAQQRTKDARKKKLSGSQFELGCAGFDDPTARGKSTASGMKSPWKNAAYMKSRPTFSRQRAQDKARRAKLSGTQWELGCPAYDDPTARGKSTASQMKSPWDAPSMVNRLSGSDQRAVDKARRMKLSASTLEIGFAGFDDPSARSQSTASKMTSPWESEAMRNRPTASRQRAIDKARRTKLSASTLSIGCAAFDDAGARGHSTASEMTSPWDAPSMANRLSGSDQLAVDKARRMKLSASTLSIGCPAFDDVNARGKSTAKVAAAATAAAIAAGKHVSLAELHAENKARKTKLSASTITLGCPAFDDPSARLSSTASQVTDPWLSKEYGANRPSYSAQRRTQDARKKKLSGSQFELGAPQFDDPTARCVLSSSLQQ